MTLTATTSGLARISGINWCRAAFSQVFASTEEVELPPQNVQFDKPYNVFWQSAGTTSGTLIFGFTGTVTVDDIALDGLTMQPGDEIRIRLNTETANSGWTEASGSSGNVYDSGLIACGVVPGYDIFSLSLSDTAQDVLSMQVDLVVSSRALPGPGFFRVGRVWAGPSVVPSINVILGFSDGWFDPSNVTIEQFSGTNYVTTLPKFRQLQFAWNFLSESEALGTPSLAGLPVTGALPPDGLKSIGMLAGSSQAVLFVPNPSSPRLAQEAVMGLLQKLNPIVNPAFDLWSWAAQVNQSL